MKKLLLITLSLLIGSAMIAQNRAMLLEEYFDGSSMPTGWSIAGMGTQNWSVSPTNNAGGDANEMLLYYGPQFNGTSRLVTPAVDLTGISSAVFSFKHYLDNYSGSHVLGVATSSDNGATWNVGWQQNYSSDGGYSVTQTIETSDFGKENVKFCIFYTGNSYNIDNWYFDNILLFVVENLDAQLSAIKIPAIISKETPVPVVFNVTNFGETEITSLEVAYTVTDNADPDAEVEPVVQNFAVNIPSLGSTELTFNTPMVLLPGAYFLNVSILSVNGVEDDVIDNNDKIRSFGCAYGFTEKVPMIEHFSSSSCGPCVSVNNQMNTFCNNNAGRFTYTKYAMNWPGSGDPYYTQEGYTRRVYYGVSAVPDLFLEGVERPSSSIQALFTNACNQPAYADIRGMFTVDGNVVHMDLDLTAYVALENVRLYVTINEKETKNNVGGNGETSFHHVMMKMMPNGNGTPLSLNGCETRHFEFTQDMTSTHVEEMDDLEVSVFLQNYATREIYNSHFLNEGGEYPAPVLNLMMVSEDNRESGTITATWDAPEGSTPLGYKVILNGEVVEELTTDLSYVFESQDGTFNVIEVQAIYGDGVNSVKCVAGMSYIWGVEEESTFNCQLFPNPANDRIYIKAEENLREVRVYNALGMMVKTVNVDGDSQTLDIADIANGIYFVQMNTESGATVTRRLVVSH